MVGEFGEDDVLVKRLRAEHDNIRIAVSLVALSFVDRFELPVCRVKQVHARMLVTSASAICFGSPIE